MRSPRLLVSLLAVGLLSVAAPHAAADKPDAPPGQSKDQGKAEKCERGRSFCAGSATADITPPITSPQFAYTYRQCAVGGPADVAGHTVGAHEHVEEFAFWLAGGGPGCASDKANAEAYSKTFPPSEGTYGRLQANAFVLDDGRQRVAIVQADLGGIPGELHTRVAELTTPAGVDLDHLLISATHTHGSTGGIFASTGYAALGGDLFDRRIFEAVAAGIAKSVTEAVSRLTPARMAVGFGEIANANGNRSTGAWQRNPEALLGESPQATRLMVMRVDSTKGVPLGVITNFTNHGVIHGTFNPYFSGDNQGQATRQVTAAIRARAEAQGIALPDGWEVVDALTNGPAGDITPRSDNGGWSYSRYGSIEGSSFEQLAKMENAGSRQVAEAVRLWDDLGPQLSGEVTLDARLDRVCLCGQDVGNDPHDPYDREDFAPVGVKDWTHTDDPRYFGTSEIPILGAGDTTREPTTVFEGHHRKKARLIAAAPTVEPKAARVQILRINDLALVTMPGEPTIQMGRRIERSVVAASGGLFTKAVLVGLADDYVSYMATTQEYEEHDYEGDFSLWGQQTGNLFKERLVEMTGLMVTGSPVAPCTEARGCSLEEPTPLVTAAPSRFLQDVQAGTPAAQPTAVQRFAGTAFTWNGGSPGAEWSPDDALVELQQQSGTAWETVYSDLDTDLVLRYDKRGPLHTWTAYVDPAKDLPAGTYRLLATGHAGTAGGSRTAYELASAAFAISESTRLSLVKRADGRYEVVHPAPDGTRNFRYREKVSQTATINGVAGPTFSLAPGIILPAGAIVDAWGNTNGSPITVA